MEDDDLDFTRLSDEIDLKPTKVIYKGQQIVKGKIATNNIWRYEIKVGKENDISGLLILLDKLLPYSENIKLYTTKYSEVSINCYIRSDMSQIGFVLTPEMINKLDKLNLELNFHILSFGFAEE